MNNIFEVFSPDSNVVNLHAALITREQTYAPVGTPLNDLVSDILPGEEHVIKLLHCVSVRAPQSVEIKIPDRISFILENIQTTLETDVKWCYWGYKNIYENVSIVDPVRILNPGEVLSEITWCNTGNTSIRIHHNLLVAQLIPKGC